MSYDPIEFVDQPSPVSGDPSAPKLNAANLAHMQTQYQEAKDYVDGKIDVEVGRANAAYGTSAQGAKADTAVQPADLAAALNGLVVDGDVLLAHTGVAWYQVGAVAPDTYAALGTRGQEVATLTGATGYTRQDAGVPVNPAAQSRMRRCVLHNDGDRVVYYLDADDATKIAGVWDSGIGLQAGWVRVHEGAFDPVRPIPGQATTGSTGLRAGVPAYAADHTYAKGDRVLSGGSLWDSLADNQLGVAPAAGTAAADLTGTAGQVMVEIPRFYYLWGYDSGLKRHAIEVAFDAAEYAPFPLLTDDPDLPASKIVNGRAFAVHPAFQKGGVERRARYIAAFGTSATDTGNNTSGTLRSIADGATTNTTNVSLTNFTAKARARNAGLTDPSGFANNVWQVADNWLWHALQVLLVTEYRTLYSQAVLGGGNISGSDYNKIAGRSAALGSSSGQFNATPALTTPSAGGDSDGMLYRGIEDLWGTAWHRTAGGVIRNTAAGKEVYLSNSPKDFLDTSSTTTSYELIASGGSVPASDNWYYPDGLVHGFFLASSITGSSTTYLTDGNYLRAATDNSINILLWGANAGGGAYAGAFALLATRTTGSADADLGATLAR